MGILIAIEITTNSWSDRGGLPNHRSGQSNKLNAVTTNKNSKCHVTKLFRMDGVQRRPVLKNSYEASRDSW